VKQRCGAVVRNGHPRFEDQAKGKVKEMSLKFEGEGFRQALNASNGTPVPVKVRMIEDDLTEACVLLCSKMSGVKVSDLERIVMMASAIVEQCNAIVQSGHVVYDAASVEVSK
jgi:hypothetical protein